MKIQFSFEVLRKITFFGRVKIFLLTLNFGWNAQHEMSYENQFEECMSRTLSEYVNIFKDKMASDEV